MEEKEMKKERLYELEKQFVDIIHAEGKPVYVSAIVLRLKSLNQNVSKSDIDWIVLKLLSEGKIYNIS